MKIYYFSLLILEAFKKLTWGKVSNIHQTSAGWAFTVTDTLNGDEYLCCAYPVKSTKFVCPESADQLLAMTKEAKNG